jgi:hypothetical protein
VPPVQIYDELLNELKPLISDEDLHLPHFGLASVVAISLATLSSINIVRPEIMPSLHTTLRTSILAMFNVHSEELRSTAAYAIGRVSAGNMGFNVPIVFQEIQTDLRKRYLLLHALKEVLTRHTQKQGGQAGIRGTCIRDLDALVR